MVSGNVLMIIRKSGAYVPLGNRVTESRIEAMLSMLVKGHES